MTADPSRCSQLTAKPGGNDAAMAEAVSRMVSLSLRSAVDPKDVVKQLRGITDMPAWDQGQLIRSVPDAIALVLYDVIAASELQRDDPAARRRRTVDYA